MSDAPHAAPWPLSLAILREACALTGDSCESADPATNYLARVTRGDRFFFSVSGFGPAYPLNPSFATAIADDKLQTASVLEAAGVVGVPTRAFFADAADAARYASGQAPSDAIAYAESAGYPLFAKLNRGTHGRLAAKLANTDDLIAFMREARGADRLFLLQPVIAEPEARLFVLDGRVRFLYRREARVIAGDGERTLGALIADYLNDPGFAEEPTALAAVAETVTRLARVKRALGDVPAKGEAVFTADAANLAQGGRLADLSFEVSEAVHAWAARVGAATGLQTFGADVFCGAGLDNPAGYRVIEINANPSLLGLWRIGERSACLTIWRDVLERFFAS